jgi:hypothetical protein
VTNHGSGPLNAWTRTERPGAQLCVLSSPKHEAVPVGEPTSMTTRPRDMMHRSCRTVRRTLAGLALLSSLVACGMTSAKPSPLGTSPISTNAVTSAALLALAPTPPGAVAVSALPGKVFSQPAFHPVCQPLDVRTAYWTSSLAGPTVVEYLMTHPGSHLQVSGSGSGTNKGVVTNWEVTLNSKGGTSGTHSVASGQTMLVYEIPPLPRGVGIRVDAEVVPAGAVCSRS